MRRDTEKQRECTISLPVLGERVSSGIRLNEIERKVIEGRSELINDLAHNDAQSENILFLHRSHL